MKFVSLLFISCLLAACCASHPATVPQGYMVCHSDHECNLKAGEYCGFVAVDTVPVCRGGWK
jgi:hypothetical protein